MDDNEKKVRDSLFVLHKNGNLTNKSMARETERVRSEDIREIFERGIESDSKEVIKEVSNKLRKMTK